METLPGLENTPPGGDMLASVEATLAYKTKHNLLTPEHDALCALARKLAIAIDAGAASAKTSVPQSAQQLLNTLAQLPSIVVEESSDPLADAMRAEA